MNSRSIQIDIGHLLSVLLNWMQSMVRPSPEKATFSQPSFEMRST